MVFVPPKVRNCVDRSMAVKQMNFLRWQDMALDSLTIGFGSCGASFIRPRGTRFTFDQSHRRRDIMAGVGTVAVEAKAAGIPSLSLDVDPVSVFFSKVKTTPISWTILRQAWNDLLARCKSSKGAIKSSLPGGFVTSDRTMRTELTRLAAKDFERLTFWFRR